MIFMLTLMNAAPLTSHGRRTRGTRRFAPQLGEETHE